MTPEDAQAFLFASLVLAGMATVVFESVKRDSAEARRLCICGHRLRATGDLGHVQRHDADSTAFWPGAKYKPGQCRACRCKAFIPK